MRAIEINRKHIHKSFTGKPLFCKGKLLFAIPTEEELKAIPIEGCPDKYVWFTTSIIDGLPCKEIFKPFIISELEKVRVGDHAFDHKTFKIYLIVFGLPQSNDEINIKDAIKQKLKKVIALPEHFSIPTLTDITNFKYNTETEVFVECEYKQWTSRGRFTTAINSVTKWEDATGYSHFIKFTDKRITLLPMLI